MEMRRIHFVIDTDGNESFRGFGCEIRRQQPVKEAGDDVRSL
jgi:hypothetical protein